MEWLSGRAQATSIIEVKQHIDVLVFNGLSSGYDRNVVSSSGLPLDNT